MAFQRLPEAVQTLYAELFELTVHAEAEATAQGAPHGTFVSRLSPSLQDRLGGVLE